MKPTYFFRSMIVISGSILLFGAYTQAATLYWDGADSGANAQGGAGTWDTSTFNWDTLATAGSDIQWTSADYAVFGGTAGTVTVGSGITTTGIDFTTTGYTLDATTNGLAFSSGSNQIRVSGATGVATINGAISGTGSMHIQSLHTGILGLFPAVNFGGTSTGGWTGATTITRGIALNLTDSNQALNNTSGISLNGGIIQITNASATTATNNKINDSAGISFDNGGSIRVTNTNSATDAYSETIGDVTLNSGYCSFLFTVNQNLAGGSQALTLNSLTRNGYSVVAFGSTGNATNVIKVTGATQTAANKIIGAWALSGNGNTDNDYAVYNASGQIVNRAASLTSAETSFTTTWSDTANIATNLAAGTLTANRTFNTLRFSNASSLSVGDFALASYGILNGGGNYSLNVGTSGYITIPTDNGDQALYLIAGNGTLTVNAPIKDNGSTKLTLVLGGGGSGSRTDLFGTNTYSGGTVIAKSAVRNSVTGGYGEVRIANNSAFGATTNFLQFDSGSLNLQTFDVIVGAFSGGPASYISAGTGGSLTVGTGTSTTSSTEFKGSIIGGEIIKTGDGRLILSGINTANATTAQYTVNAGILQFAKTDSLMQSNTANWTKAKIIGNSGGTLAFNVGGTGEFTSGNVTTLLTNLGGLGGSVAASEGLQAGSGIGFDTSNATGGTFTVADNIANSTGAGGGAIGLTKLGTGKLTLTGANTFTGKTLISGGTLALSGTGSIANSSTIQINSATTLDVTGLTGNYTLGSAQTLSGNGTILATGKTVTVNGTVSAGNSPGVITQNGGTYQLGADGNMNMQIHNAAGAAGVGYDTINLINGGTLDLSLLSTLSTYDINLWSLSGIGPDVNGDAINFNNSQNYTWTLISTGSTISGFNSNLFTINVGAINGTNGFTNALGGGSFSVGLADSNTDLVLNFTAIPEPRAILLSCLGVLFLIVRRRR